jgi:hypothetical protein
VLAEDVQVARLDVWLVRDRRHVIGVDQTLMELVELVLAGQVIEQPTQAVVGRVEILE